MQKITVRVGGVESVDVAGDFSGLRAPFTMVPARPRRCGNCRCQSTAESTRSISVRMAANGWRRPVCRRHEGHKFNGEVGILIIKP